MKVTQLRGLLPNGLSATQHKEKPMKKTIRSSASGCSVEIHNLMIMDKNEISASNIVKNSYLAGGHSKPFFSPVMAYRKHVFSVVNSQSRSDYSASPYDEGSFTGKKGDRLGSFMEGISELIGIPSRGPRFSSVDSELIILALPAIIGQAIEPFSQLMETAFIGRLGPLELASAGVSISIFNIVSRLFNIPLLSITTSFVAEDIAKNTHRDVLDRDSQEENGVGKPLFEESPERTQLPSVSTALFLAAGIGILEAAGLYLGTGMFLNVMGLPLASPMRSPAKRFLSLRALGAPAVVLSLAIQGIFRGFKDTRTPLLCLGVGNVSAVILLPLFIYSFDLGITGAAIATIASQYIVTLLLIWFLNKRVVLLPPKIEDLQFDGYMKSDDLLDVVHLGLKDHIVLLLPNSHNSELPLTNKAAKAAHLFYEKGIGPIL